MEMKLIEVLILILIILGPPLILTGGVVCVLGFGSLRLNAEKGLLKQGLFWIGILLPIIYFFVFGGIAWNDYIIEISSQGLFTFFEISKIPLTFLSLTLPLTILIIRFHATEQTAKQIAITSHKNNLDSFYAHRKEMFFYFEQIEEADYFGALKGHFSIHPRLHKNFFVGSPNLGVPEINEKAFKNFEGALSSARFFIDTVLKNKIPDKSFDYYMVNACPQILYLATLLGLREIIDEISFKGVSLELEVNGKGKGEYLSIGTTTDHFVASFRYANDYFKNLCDFAGYPIKETEEKYSYIDTGGKFRTMAIPKTIEELHKNEIQDRWEKQIGEYVQ